MDVVVSVVVPTYGRPAMARACVESVLAQQVNVPFEVIVVDDGGTPAASDELGRITDARLQLHRQSNGGPARARNAGLKRARGTYVVFLDDDCTADPGWLAGMVAGFTGGVVMVQGAVHPPSGEASPLRWHYVAADGRHDLTCNLGVVREVALRMGGLDETYPDAAGEDYDFCWRMEREGAVVFRADAAITHALVPLTWKKRRSRPRLWRSNFRFFAMHPERISRARLPWPVDAPLRPIASLHPLLRIGTYLAAAPFIEAVRAARRHGPEGLGQELAACVFNLAEGVRRSPEYLAWWRTGKKDAARGG